MSDDNLRQAVALFRYGLIADFIHLPPGSRGLYAKLREKAKHSHTIPGSTRTHVAAETLRDWLADYRRGGFDALLPKVRADIGQSRVLAQDLADALLELKEAQPELSIPQLLRALKEQGRVPASSAPAHSTVHRLLTRVGLMDKNRDAPSGHDRRRFAFAHAGQLWMSDVMHGPTVGVGRGARRKAYLIAFLDDATRLVPYCAFALSENTQSFLPVFKQALMRRGIPQRLYVDNGANYRSQHLALICAKLGIAIIHARPYQPQGKGKQERWFRTVRAQLLPRLTADDTASLEALNRRLWSWVEGEYHQTPHRGLDDDRTPHEQWAAAASQVRMPERSLNLDDVFLFEARRRVQKDRTVSLNGTVFEVDALLVGETITLRHDPAAPAARGVEVWHDNKFVARAHPVDAYANCFVRRNRSNNNLDPDTPTDTQPKGLALRNLKRDEESR